MGFPYPYPLGLPKGSVRATITMAISVNLVILTLYNSVWASKLSTMTAVVITFYFGGRMRSGKVIVPRDTLASQRAWGLPAGTIRSILFLLFVGTTGYLLYLANYNLTAVPGYLFELLNIIVGYVFGRTFNKAKKRFIKKKDEEGNVSQATLFDHFKALAVLVIVGLTIYLTHSTTNDNDIAVMILITSILLGFYFGERD